MIPILFAAAAVAMPAPAGTITVASLSAPAVIEDPNWVRTPSMDEFVAAFPVAAIEKGASGEALIECRVAAEGALDGCFVLTERGGDYGFGAATVALADHYRMAPVSLSGQQVAGGVVRVSMAWKLN